VRAGNIEHVDVMPVWVNVKEDPISPNPPAPGRALGRQPLDVTAEGISLHLLQRGKD
jgi:hypothetical protein